MFLFFGGREPLPGPLSEPLSEPPRTVAAIVPRVGLRSAAISARINASNSVMFETLDSTEFSMVCQILPYAPVKNEMLLFA